jgi:DNA mismatch endonuclease (patch repair protein)
MRAVKSRDTGVERAVRRLIHGMGYRYRLHRRDLPGKPDIVFPTYRKVIFVHGCFWHGHKCLRGDRVPKSNREYWKRKISRNSERDEANLKALHDANWHVLILWECEIPNTASLADHLRRFLGPQTERGKKKGLSPNC